MHYVVRYSFNYVTVSLSTLVNIAGENMQTYLPYAQDMAKFNSGDTEVLYLSLFVGFKLTNRIVEFINLLGVE